MRSQKVTVGRVGKKGRGAGTGGALVAGASAAPSPAVPPKMDNVAMPGCTVCGTLVSANVRVLQCDRCGDPNKWKCIECLAMSAEAYDSLIECKELCWFCKDCSKDIALTKDDREDKVLGLFERLMDKLCAMEDRLKEKADVTVFDELEEKMQ